MAREPLDAYKKLESLKSDRSNWESLWQDIGDYIIPNKNDILSVKSPGQKRNLQIYDTTGVQMNELLAGALHGMLTNPSSYFFELYTGIPEIDKDDEVRKWLQSSAKTMHDVMNNSNFQTEIHEVYMDLGSFGTGVMSIEEDDANVVRFLSHHLSKVYIDENNYGFVDTVFRCYDWRPHEIIRFLGPKDSPEWLRRLDESGQDKKLEILNVVEPRSKYSNKAINSKMYKYASCWYLKDGNSNAKVDLVRESGFRTMPYVTPRWTKGTGEIYGRSPGMKCLPDVKMINKLMQILVRANEKAMDPPLLIPDDSVIGLIQTTPGGLNFFRGGTQDFIRPLETGAKIEIGYELLERVTKSIRDAFYINQLQLQEGPQKTATEVMQIREENLRFLGPILGRQHSELLQPMIDRIYDICERKRLFKAMPQIMVDRKAAIKVQYRSTLAKAQLSSEAQNITRLVQNVAPFLQISPQVADLINSDEAVRYLANLYGSPQELLNDKKSVEAIREGRAQAQEEAAQMAQQTAMAQNAGAAAPAIKAVAGQ